MISTFIDKTQNLLNKRFFISYWFPPFIIITGLVYAQYSLFFTSSSSTFWNVFFDFISGKNYSIFPQYDFIVIYILLITIIAYLLQIITRPLFLIFEGYWSDLIPDTIPFLYNFIKQKEELLQQKKRADWNFMREKLEKFSSEGPDDLVRYRTLHNILSTQYPPHEDDIRPTDFGNYILAAEMYASVTYGMDIIFWWPRMWLILSDAERNEIEDTLTPIITLLNTIFFLFVGGIFSIVFILSKAIHGFTISGHFFLITIYEAGIIICLVLMIYGLYRLSILQSLPYGDTIRAVTDLHRLDLLAALHQSMPCSILQEKKAWKNLQQWIMVRDLSSASSYYHYNK